MKRSMIKAIRLVNGYTDNLRVKLDWDPRKVTPYQEKIQMFIMEHMADLYGAGIYDELGVKFDPQPGVDADDYMKLLRFADAEARKVCRGEAED